MSNKEFITKKFNEIIQIYDDIYDYLPSEEAAEEVYLDKWHIVDLRDECEKSFDNNAKSKVIDLNDH